ncbi:hypothetical protein AB6A40_004748 [Gnathostoma spinigerum]|uniref:Uncharacterized protein n=1 Tax=Gnathostoma spinigerum TaxID=75299 RepID=A0ABD6EIR0_9BILA
MNSGRRSSTSTYPWRRHELRTTSSDCTPIASSSSSFIHEDSHQKLQNLAKQHANHLRGSCDRLLFDHAHNCLVELLRPSRRWLLHVSQKRSTTSLPSHSGSFPRRVTVVDKPGQDKAHYTGTRTRSRDSFFAKTSCRTL